VAVCCSAESSPDTSSAPRSADHDGSRPAVFADEAEDTNDEQVLGSRKRNLVLSVLEKAEEDPSRELQRR
jgi:hypothetical protein